ncbi:MAG: hypothetical protein L6R36_008633 [Xanthoria steineri]|nr:MAG: hypothetical protein L6R36_008633 [Xanthoria steineri]
MSFGFSVGDSLATARLIKSIVNALQKSSESEFKELALELHAVQRALNEIEQLQPLPDQESSVNAIKIVALVCQHPLREFADKLEKYEYLGHVAGTKKNQIKRWKLKLQWGFTMEEEVQKIRTILAAHLASLNVRLSTQGLSSDFIVARSINAVHNGLTDTHKAVLEIEKATTSQQVASRQSNTFLQTLLSLVQHGLLPKLDILIDIANRLWTSNVQIVNLVTHLQDTPPVPDVQHTYFQPPCILEDALGRPLPVPAEYDLNMLRAVISARFSSGPGHKKVHAGEYEIFNTSDTAQLLSELDFQSLVPGMNITMAFVIGRYQHRTLEECPRPGCKARKFVRKSTGGRICSDCGVWFDFSRDILPRPFRLDLTEGSFHRLRTERKWFKNVKICPSNIPSLPPCVDDRGSWVEPPTISESTKERPDQETPCNTSVLPENGDKGHGYLTIQETVAAKIIRGIAEDLYLSVAELQDIATNESKPGSLGIDSIMAGSISWRLKDLAIASSKGARARNFHDPLFLESFI